MDPMGAEYEIPWTSSRISRAWKFIKILRVEPYLFLIMFQMSLKGTPSHQLLQDKICRLWYNQSVTYCYDLPTHKDSVSGPHYKSQILADTAQFGTYQTYIHTVPTLVWALFVGAWIDRYVKARKILMVLSVGSAIIENVVTLYLSINFNTNVYYHLLPNIPSMIFGGGIASRIAITHYMAKTTPPKLMAIRFMIHEMCMFVASPIGSSLGGYILVQKPYFNYGEIRNYSLVFVIALGFEVVAFLWLIIMVNENVAQKQEIKIEMKFKDFKENQKIKVEKAKEDDGKHPLSLLFDLTNVKEMVKCCIKDRPNKVRTQLWLIFISMIVMIMAFSGSGHVSNQFIQKIYQWGPDTQSYMGSLSMVMHSVATVTIVPLLISKWKVSDVPLAIIGKCFSFMSTVVKGAILSPLGAYIAMPLGCISGVSSIGTRSYMSKIIGRDEIGKVFSFMTALDTLAPMISSTIFTWIFRVTIDSYPGAVYQITAILMFFPIWAMMWIDLCTERPLVDNNKGHRHRNRGHHRNKDHNQKDSNIPVDTHF